MEQRFVKSGLVLLRNNENIALIMKYALCLALLDAIAVTVHVHGTFCIFRAVGIVRVFQASAERNHNLDIVIIVLLQIPLDFMVVTDSRKTGCGDNHHLSEAADFVLGNIAEGFHDDGRFLCEIMRVQFLIAANGAHSFGCRNIRVVRYVLCNLIAHLIGGIVRQHIQDKAFLNSLPH